MKNVKPSMYNIERCYVYNKAFAVYFEDIEREASYGCQLPSASSMDYVWEREGATMNTGAMKISGRSQYDMFDKIRNWAKERGLYEKGDPKTQYLKLIEEAGELGRAILKDDQNEVVDAIGDMVVVLTNLAELRNVSIEACIRDAYMVISKRTGKMVNGTFVKDTL